MTNLLRRLEKVEELMNPPDNQMKFEITVVFINPAGEVTGTRTFGSPKASEGNQRGQTA
jgi:hypothetical protein